MLFSQSRTFYCPNNYKKNYYFSRCFRFGKYVSAIPSNFLMSAHPNAEKKFKKVIKS